MFKTIFSKLIVIFILILVFSFSITGVALYLFITDFVSNEKKTQMIQGAEDICNYLEHNMQNQDEELFFKNLDLLLSYYNQNTKSYIWLVDENGYIMVSKPGILSIRNEDVRALLLRKLSYESGYFRLPDEKMYKSAMNSKVTKDKLGDFYGLFKDTGESWLTIERSFKYRDNYKTYNFAVFLHTPLYEFNEATWSVFKLFVLAVCISVGIAVILTYIFSLRISKPLKEMNQAAKIISGGDFQKQISIHSKDEVGELAQSFNHMVFALKNLEEMRRGFIANVSHELRTPMTSIRGFIEGILDGTIPSDKQDEYLKVVRGEIVRLNRLVNDLLDLAKMEAGELKLHPVVFNINELIRRCIIKLERLIVEKEIELEASFYEEDLFVYGDTDSIERVVINLIHNAVKFTPQQGKIEIATRLEKDKVIVSIGDNGVGIHEDEIKFIWDRFYKSDKSRSKDKSGTGLGLAIVKNIIHEHGQEIWVESEAGKGARFSFTLGHQRQNEV
ncbi:MAG: cell wall metabolism sensor histidine kinase WalK [Clostridia bacterium]|nr:cell wall metabolism sensor histidine kinase WalK [Clostridia bacterium]